MASKLTTLEFINKAHLKHEGKYDYSKSEYVLSTNKIVITCPKHGDFRQTPGNHLSGKGCRKCGLETTKTKRRCTNEEFISKSKKLHGDKYVYSKVIYENNCTKVMITCPKHGDFEQKAANHLSGKGCRKCAIEYTANKQRATSEEFIDKAKKVHDDIYDHSKIDYKNNHTNVIIICKNHGEFIQSPANHLKGQHCPVCAHITRIESKTRTTEEFIERAKKVHGDNYDYSKVEYTGNLDKIKIICSKHGEFLQSPDNHLQKRGCPRCKESRGEQEVRKFLEENGISFEAEKKFIGCKNVEPLRFDFYLPDHNVLIEYQGIQHYEPVEFFGGEQAFEKLKKRDKIKREWSRDSSFELVLIKYDVDVSQQLQKIVK